MTNALTSATEIAQTSDLFNTGDVALIIKASGEVQSITFGYDRSRLHQPEEEWNDEDRAMIEQGKKLFALTFALGHPKLMKVLLDIAADPDVVDLDTLTAMKTRH
ncbi:hypothetical protein B9J07_27890 [Sinorhizobium sp. LM21]|uniref:hypothetical protein n=1 Tax=Sinorhizobium sp. LM21 TaxID=1449788 RepID=UPI0005D77161|nr:hypothetical protein [Sinorhizobium sp. LM21]AJW30185.1 hypothetical protein pLM21S1_p65 [Sinorhizobium sp. LM21]OWZ90411.1 hypothetical protein B9J07_27890 [Sinorhizobium sp. LM21]